MTDTTAWTPGETQHRTFSPERLSSLLDRLDAAGVPLPEATSTFRQWERDSGEIQAELHRRATPARLLEMTRAEMIEHARNRAIEEASRYAAYGHLGTGTGTASARSGHYAVVEELATALREVIAADADEILDHLRPKFDSLAEAVAETVELGITPRMTAGQALDLPGDANKIRAAWQAGAHNMTALAGLVDTRVQLSQVVGVPGATRLEGVTTWWPAFSSQPMLWGASAEADVDPTAVPLPVWETVPRPRIVETAAQKVHRLTIEAGGLLRLLSVAETQQILKGVATDA